MIREVHKIVSDYGDWYDKYIAYYYSGRKKEYFGNNVPNTVKSFIDDENTDVMFVVPGNYHRYYNKMDAIKGYGGRK